MLILKVEKLLINHSWGSLQIHLVSCSQELKFTQLLTNIGMHNSSIKQELTLKSLKMHLLQIMKLAKALKVAEKFYSWDIRLWLKDTWSLTTMRRSITFRNGKCFWPKEPKQTKTWTRNSKSSSRSQTNQTREWKQQMKNMKLSALKSIVRT